MGQYHDQVNPAALMIYMGAIANGGKAAEPYLILRTESALGLPSLPHFTTRTGTLISADTAAALADLMANNVTQTYGASRFPNMDICAKSGTAEVGEGQTPHAWFAGFLRGRRRLTPLWCWWRTAAAGPLWRAAWPPRFWMSSSTDIDTKAGAR